MGGLEGECEGGLEGVRESVSLYHTVNQRK